MTRTRAAVYRDVGDAADVFSVEQVELPALGENDVRVRVAVSGINPTDWKARAGLTNRPPDGFQIPHQDGAGMVEAVGAAVRGVRRGDRVWMHLAAFQRRHGTAAAHVVIPSRLVRLLPDDASFELGACLGVPAMTAAHCLGGDPTALAGRTVLVAGGAGAVGHYAIQLARFAGARVIATVSTDHKAALAAVAGAHLVVRYADADAPERIRAFAGGVDRIVEVALPDNQQLDLAVLGTGGTVACYGSSGDITLSALEFTKRNARLQFVLLYALSESERTAAADWIDAALAARALTALPITAFPLTAVAEAQDAVRRGLVGKAVLDLRTEEEGES